MQGNVQDGNPINMIHLNEHQFTNFIVERIKGHVIQKMDEKAFWSGDSNSERRKATENTKQGKKKRITVET